ncbi:MULTISPECIES: hypothetical protein [Vibrio]|uniref:Uncharacterized protein n=1 Tax=Vibrio echinoideorum TaxID=2100116 RepID=A0ABU9FSE2_9VIBR|nr:MULTISPECIES: hypothetical protein [Vibrio]SBS62872.1 hypothetical protein VHE8714_01440 [Vibrio splendidus]
MMLGRVKVNNLFATIDWCLKKTFPTDYDSRCLYTACAIYSILQKEGVSSIIVGGNVGAFTMSIDGRQASLEGFAGSNRDQPSHYWVEVNDVLLDPNVSYLPKSSKIPRVPMPMIAWKRKGTLPKSLQYRAQIRYDENVEFRFPDDIAERISGFVDMCQKRYSSKAAKKKLSGFILSSPENLHQYAISGNKWAVGAMRFESLPSVPTI